MNSSRAWALKSFAVVFFLAVYGVVLASPQQAFNEDAFKAAKAAGKAVIVEVHADWCAECKAQNLVLNKLTADARYAEVVRLRVDYDKQKDLVKAFKARKQSTLIFFKGEVEVARVTGETNANRIKALVDKAVPASRI